MYNAQIRTLECADFHPFYSGSVNSKSTWVPQLEIVPQERPWWPLPEWCVAHLKGIQLVVYLQMDCTANVYKDIRASLQYKSDVLRLRNKVLSELKVTLWQSSPSRLDKLDIPQDHKLFVVPDEDRALVEIRAPRPLLMDAYARRNNDLTRLQYVLEPLAKLRNLGRVSITGNVDAAFSSKLSEWLRRKNEDERVLPANKALGVLVERGSNFVQALDFTEPMFDWTNIN